MQPQNMTLGEMDAMAAYVNLPFGAAKELYEQLRQPDGHVPRPGCAAGCAVS